MTEPARRVPPLWRNLSFTLMWTSTAASGFGDRMMMLAALALLGGMVAGVDATSTQAATQFWFFLPYLIFSVPGGWLADRIPRKWLLLTCDEARGVILLWAFGALAAATGPANIDAAHHWRVYLALAAIGTFAAIFNPTRNAIIPQIIPRPQLQAGNAVILVINVVASQVGLLVGEAIVDQSAAQSVRSGLLLGAGFYLVSGTFFAFLRPVQTAVPGVAPVTPRPRRKRSLLAAAKYSLAHRRVLILIALNVLIWPPAAVVTSGLFGLAKMHHGLAGDALLTYFARVSVTLGVGMLLGAAIITAIRTRQQAAIVYLGALGMAGLCILLLAVVPWMPFTYAAALGIGVFGNMAIVSILSLLQSITPNHIRGRVMGLNSLLNTIASVGVYGMVWQMPDADRNIVYVMAGLGPLLALVGFACLVVHLCSGPLPPMTNALHRLDALWVYSWHRLEVRGKHHVPATGPLILAANHTTGLDPFLIQAPARRLVRWVMLTSYRFRVAEPLWRAIRPITLDLGDGDLSKIREIIRALQEGDVVGLFPEGSLQREVRELQPFRPGIVLVARRADAPVVPVWIEGTPMRKGMLWHFLQPSQSRVTFGRPFVIDRHASQEQTIEQLRAKLLELAGGGGAARHGD